MTLRRRHSTLNINTRLQNLTTNNLLNLSMNNVSNTIRLLINTSRNQQRNRKIMRVNRHTTQRNNTHIRRTSHYKLSHNTNLIIRQLKPQRIIMSSTNKMTMITFRTSTSITRPNRIRNKLSRPRDRRNHQHCNRSLQAYGSFQVRRTSQRR